MKINVDDNNTEKISDIKCENYNYKTSSIKKDNDPFSFSSSSIKNNNSNFHNNKTSLSSKSTNSYDKRLSIRMQKKRNKYNYDEYDDNNLELNFRHTAYLISIWFIFSIIFISGFIVHFDSTNNVTASSILWTFSSVICFFALIYSFLYYKCLNSKTDFEKHKYLKFIPC